MYRVFVKTLVQNFSVKMDTGPVSIHLEVNTRVVPEVNLRNYYPLFQWHPRKYFMNYEELWYVQGLV